MVGCPWVKRSIDNTTGQRSLFLDSSYFLNSTNIFFNSSRIFFSSQISNCSHDISLGTLSIFFFRSWTYILQISTHIFLFHSVYFTSSDLRILFSTNRLHWINIILVLTDSCKITVVGRIALHSVQLQLLIQRPLLKKNGYLAVCCSLRMFKEGYATSAIT